MYALKTVYSAPNTEVDDDKVRGILEYMYLDHLLIGLQY